MKRMFVSLLAVLLLAGCGERVTCEDMPGPDRPEGFTVSTEWAEYDPSVARVWFLVENRGETDAETGVEFTLEKWLDTGGGEWHPVPLAENAAWEAVALTLPSGGTRALCCDFSMFDGDFSDGGRFRIVKEIEGRTCAGEFQLAEGAAVSAERPYGYAPLEELPEDYGIIGAGSETPEVDPDAGVIFTAGATLGAERLSAFLQKVSLGIPCQLRTVQDYGEGMPMVIDVLYENGSFLWRMRSGGELTERRLSYLVTDGQDLYLSNGADWESGARYGDRRIFLVPERMPGLEDAVLLVEKLTADRLAGNTARYQVWSDDGEYCAALTEGLTAFSVSWQKPGEGAWGRSHDLQNWGGPETAIRGLEWQEGGSLLLHCESAGGGVSTLVFDPEGETLTAAVRGLPSSADQAETRGAQYAPRGFSPSFKKRRIDKKGPPLIE